jgi:NitT/TauT family transport system substrate-binding protein
MAMSTQLRVSRRQAVLLGISASVASLLAACSGAPAAPSVPPAAATPASTAASAPASSTASAAPTTAASAAPTTGTGAAPTTGTGGGQPVTVGATAIIASAGLFVAMERGYFSQQGLDVQTTIVANSNDTLPLVATGKMDVANNAVTAFMVNAVNDGVNMKWVAGQAVYTRKHGTLGLVVRKDLYDSGQVRGLKDLKGRKIAVPIIAGGGAIVLDKGLAQAGLSKADVDLSELAVPNMPAALQNGALDAVLPAEPVVVQIADQGIGVILMYSDEMFPNMESTQWMYSPAFAANRQEAGVKYMIGLLKGARDFNRAFADGTDKADILNILIKYTSVKDPALYDKMQVSALSGNGSLDASNLQEQIDWLVKYKLVKNRVEASDLIDTTFTDRAVQVIGRV